MRALILIAAIVLVVCFAVAMIAVGIRIGRARERTARRGIDPRYHARLEAFAMTVLAPPADLEGDFTVLSQEHQALGRGILRDRPTVNH